MKKLSNAEIGQRCADSIRPDLFKPLVQRVADDIYERLLESVQDYLCDNSEYNIAARIDVAQQQALSDRRKLEAERGITTDLLKALEEVANSGEFTCYNDAAWDRVNDAITRARGGAL